MKSKVKHILLLMSVAVAGGLLLASCRPKTAPDSPGVGERTGAAIDRATDKSADAAKSTLDAAKEMTGAAVEKTGEALEKAGNAVEKKGADMQE